MEYDRIILELLDRVKKLEEEVKELKEGKNETAAASQNSNSSDNFYGMKKESQTAKVVNYIYMVLKSEKEKGEESVVLVSNNLQRANGLKNRIPLVCNAMRTVMAKVQNEVVADTPSHNSSTYAVKFYLKDIE